MYIWVKEFQKVSVMRLCQTLSLGSAQSSNFHTSHSRQHTQFAGIAQSVSVEKFRGVRSVEVSVKCSPELLATTHQFMRGMQERKRSGREGGC